MNKIIKIFLWALAFVPLVVDNSIFTPTNTNFYLRTLILLSCGLFLIQYISYKKYRNKITEKIKKIIKNPIMISVASFIFILIISTIFAVDKYSAFWGNTERAEGLVGLVYLFSFFTYSLLIFETKDWLWFFRLSLITSSILLIKEFIEFFSGEGRPSSFIGNPAFLAGYLLFSIFSAVVVFYFTEGKNNFFKYFSIAVLIFSILGIFLTQSRGTILGLIFGFISILIYAVFKSENLLPEKFNLRKISIAVLCVLFVISSVFFVTRKNEVWQKIPGFSRIAVIGSDDATTNTRILMWKLSLNAVNPIQNGLEKFLIGWGPENFSLAYGKYYQIEQFKYEKAWFNRAHNELFDRLVMNGILGLIFYLAIWFFLFKYIFTNKKDFLLNLGILFFGSAFLVHLLFVFNEMVTFVPFFVLLAFPIHLYINKDSNEEIKNNKHITTQPDKQNTVYTSIFLSTLTIFVFFVYFRNDLPAFIQIKTYSSLRVNGNEKYIADNVDRVFEPFTTAQEKIRYDFLPFISNNYNPMHKDTVSLYDITLSKAEDYVNRVPFNIQALAILADNYTNHGHSTNNLEFLKKGEDCFRKILLLAPNRQDFNSGLAANLLYQNKFVESFNLFEKVFEDDSAYFTNSKDANATGFYTLFIKHFYEAKDLPNFIKTAQRLNENHFSNSATLDLIINYVQKNNAWPFVNFN